jgi:hypothetical protein
MSKTEAPRIEVCRVAADWVVGEVMGNQVVVEGSRMMGGDKVASFCWYSGEGKQNKCPTNCVRHDLCNPREVAGR